MTPAGRSGSRAEETRHRKATRRFSPASGPGWIQKACPTPSRVGVHRLVIVFAIYNVNRGCNGASGRSRWLEEAPNVEAITQVPQ